MLLSPFQPKRSLTSVVKMRQSLESDFSSAVLFLQTYQGPHGILKNAASPVRIALDALFQQATIGACTTEAPTDTLELAAWEKWQALGDLSKEQAMQQYIKTLDDLVDNWRRSPSLRRATSEVAPATPPPLMDRLPAFAQELDAIKTKLQTQVVDHEALADAVNTLTHDTNAHFSRELRQLDLVRTHTTEALKASEAQVHEHKLELALLREKHYQLQAIVERSVVFRAEELVLQTWTSATQWLQLRYVRMLLVSLFLTFVWRKLLHRRLPRFIADTLIAIISNLSGKDGE
ncbi:hypothetical protein SDRG_04931 [Saprolegnia diclina VS20]|uniref:ACB domain-containing protein n=1 Tax=Saprolegnia diclina (strain VS20) TaxID=1156394 RepID=T0RZ38_SAPDV|nr:hypothetical protein SDRG_04931 [Saprolegnia diclina VS20]EQC37913.1 hypothetical protein SDRG_04931 [Saprolegnia diclina VS20]|eukprot:XP_008608846.1 hypothetical protein SDRG_04931 [Saprolegnia diclina VS20]